MINCYTQNCENLLELSNQIIDSTFVNFNPFCYNLFFLFLELKLYAKKSTHNWTHWTRWFLFG